MLEVSRFLTYKMFSLSRKIGISRKWFVLAKKKNVFTEVVRTIIQCQLFFCSWSSGRDFKVKIINLFMSKNYQFSRYFDLNLSTITNNNLRHWWAPRPPPNQTNFINICLIRSIAYEIFRFVEIKETLCIYLLTFSSLLFCDYTF